MDHIDRTNCSRLPTAIEITNSDINTIPTKKIRRPPQHKCSSTKHTKLPFHQHMNEKYSRHSILAFKQCNEHRTHLKRLQCPQNQLHHNYFDSHEFPQSTTRSSTRFNFKQNNQYFSRFYLIFSFVLIYLLDKINCDQGKYRWCIHRQLLQND